MIEPYIFRGSSVRILDSKITDEGRTATVIHEASHQLAGTGDDVNLSGNIIKPYDGTSKTTGQTGCTSRHFTSLLSSLALNLMTDTKSVNPPKTLAELEKDTKYTSVRDNAKNMHDNAESYAYVYSISSSDRKSR